MCSHGSYNAGSHRQPHVLIQAMLMMTQLLCASQNSALAETIAQAQPLSFRKRLSITSLSSGPIVEHSYLESAIHRWAGKDGPGKAPISNSCRTRIRPDPASDDSMWVNVASIRCEFVSACLFSSMDSLIDSFDFRHSRPDPFSASILISQSFSNT